MSYCRFSSDDFRCDLYVYEAGEGFVVHVANTRVLGDVPPSPDITAVPAQEFADAVNAQIKFLGMAKRQPIGLPCDGEIYVEETLGDLYDRLIILRDMGYRFPDDVLECINDERKYEE
jgi:hypothetical protein